jgi:hypothetical protein
MSMILQDIVESKEQAQAHLKKWRDSGFTAKSILNPNTGSYKIYVGSFGARYRKMKRMTRQGRG